MLIPASKKRKPSKKGMEKGIGFTICEGKITEAIEQSKRALDVFYNKESKMPPHTILTSVYSINRTELMGVRELFDGLQDNIISPKHKQARDLCLTQLNLLESLVLSDKDDINDPVFPTFTQGFVDWITATHNVMLDQSSWGKRKRNYDWFINKYCDYTPEYIKSRLIKDLDKEQGEEEKETYDRCL